MKKAIVTGGTSGIGKEAAKILLESGAKVAIIGRDKVKGKLSQKELDSENVNFFAADIRNPKICEEVAKNAAQFLGGADILINSAGVYLEKPVLDTSEDDYNLIVDTNLKGSFFMTKAVIPFLIKSPAASVVNIASDAAIRGNYCCSVYAASKGALVAFTKSLSLELASFNVRVNAVAPGDALTPMTERQLKGDRENLLKEMESVYPLKRIASAKEIAEVAVFLASDKASFVTGAVWSVDGGLSA